MKFTCSTSYLESRTVYGDKKRGTRKVTLTERKEKGKEAGRIMKPQFLTIVALDISRPIHKKINPSLITRSYPDELLLKWMRR